MIEDIRVLSLFSGCGGMDLGFEGNFTVHKKSINTKVHPEWENGNKGKEWIRLPRTRFKTVFANDIFPAAKTAWTNYFSQRNHCEDEFKLASIVDLVKMHESGVNVFPKAEIVTGGFPCQDFSVAGKRNGFNSHKDHYGNYRININMPTEETRGKLYIWMRKVIEIVKPKVFVAENVKGLVSLADTKSIIESDFRSIGNGYLVVPARVLYAPSYGVPQSRERVIFIGFSKLDLSKDAILALSQSKITRGFDPYPQITHGSIDLINSQEESIMPYVNVSDYFYGLVEPQESNDPSQQAFSKAKWYGSHCQGHTEVNIFGIGPTIRAEHHGNIEFRRLSVDHGGKNKIELEKGLIERRLTVRECARIQTFPDEFEFYIDQKLKGSGVSVSDAYKLIGNAVPPLLAFNVAWRLQELWPKLF